ncbi:MAG TPA: CBS domain-containing protein [Pyrinomonadaceae bacterium]|nr:CBS domain-containing protein [Pyrinomonadaceae bacterium]
MSETALNQKSRLRCREIMTKQVLTVTPEMSLYDVAKRMKEGDIGVLPVVENETNKLVGIITDRDIVVRVVAEEKIVRETLVGDVMTTEVFTAKPDDFAFEAIRTMGDKQVRRVPIIDGEGVLQGIVSMADVALEMEDEREIAETLEEISSGQAFWRKN